MSFKLEDIEKLTDETRYEFDRFIKRIHLKFNAIPKVFDLRGKDWGDLYSAGVPRVILVTSYIKEMALDSLHRHIHLFRDGTKTYADVKQEFRKTLFDPVKFLREGWKLQKMKMKGDDILEYNNKFKQLLGDISDEQRLLRENDTFIGY